MSLPNNNNNNNRPRYNPPANPPRNNSPGTQRALDQINHLNQNFDPRHVQRIVEEIILTSTTADTCGLNVAFGGAFCPDNWKPYQHVVNDVYELQRIEVYSKGGGEGDGTAGGGGKHVDLGTSVNRRPHLLMKFFPEQPPAPEVFGFFAEHFPDAVAAAQEEAHLAVTSVFDGCVLRAPPDVDPRDERAARGFLTSGKANLWLDPAAVAQLPFRDGLFGSGQGLAINPGTSSGTARTIGPDDRPAARTFRHFLHVMLGATAPPDPDKHPSTREWMRRASYATRELFRRRMGDEAAAWTSIDWRLLGPGLQTVYLDLFAYATGDVSPERVLDGATKMARHCKLQLLVVGGLRTCEDHWVGSSLRRDGRADVVGKLPALAWTVDDLEQRDRLGHVVNWVKVFRGALAPGGELVLVDKRGVEDTWMRYRLDAMALGYGEAFRRAERRYGGH